MPLPKELEEKKFEIFRQFKDAPEGYGVDMEVIPASEVEKYLEKDGWISVEERLPICTSQHINHFGSGDVLVWDGVEVTIDQYWDNKVWESEKWGVSGYPITHWMPLPKPPKE